MKKLEKRIEQVRSMDLFSCPKCRESLNVEGKSLKCSNHHTYDFSKKGTVNFVLGYGEENYGMEMLEARQSISRAGLFDGILDSLLGEIRASGKRSIRILDAGCGDGSQLEYLADALKREGIDSSLIGIDISKDGIAIAGRSESDILFMVADLSSLPFKDGSFDFVLNVFSPSNYREFRRVLTDDGILLKVVPERDYLIELREAFSLKDYSNEEIVRHMEENMKVLKRNRLSYRFPIGNQKDNLLKMTPMLWGKEPPREVALGDAITVSVSVFSLSSG